MFRLGRAIAKRLACRARPGRRPLVLEGLEDRTLLAPTFYTVNTLTDTGAGVGTTGDLRYLITRANANRNPAGSVIQFDPTIFSIAQTITLTSTLDLAEKAGPEVIEGPAADLTTVSGRFRVDPGVTATIKGLTITGGAVTGDYGGGIRVGSQAKLSLINCSISGDSATSRVVPYGQCGPPGYGGGIANAGTLIIFGTTISGNTASGGGGIWNTGTVTMSNTTVARNSSSNGGGIVNSGIGTLTALSCTIAENSGSGLCGRRPASPRSRGGVSSW